MSLAAWSAEVPAILVAFAVIVVPGLVATAPLRIGLVSRLALSGSAGVFSLGVSGVVGGILGIPFAPWQPCVIALLGGAAAWAASLRWPLVLPPDGGRRWAPIVSIMAATLVITIVGFAFVQTPDLVSQTYDNVFHMSAVASILADGDASSLRLRTLIETASATSFYPAAWHTIAASVVQLTGVSLTAAVNASWIAVGAALWVPGTMWLAQIALVRFSARTVALVAAPLSAAFGGMPYVLLSWGTLYPTFLATALLPIAVAVPLAWWRGHRATRGTGRVVAAGWGLVGLVVAVGAVGFSQPRALVTWALLIAPMVVAVVATRFLAALRRGGRSRRRAWMAVGCATAAAAALAAAGFAYVVVRLGLFERPLDERLGGPQAAASQSILDGIVQVVFLAWPTGVGSVVVWSSLALAVLVMIGAIAAARTRGLRWVVVAFVLVAILFALAAGSDEVFAKLATALWYKDRYRLLSALPIPGVILASLGAFVVVGAFRARVRWVRPSGIVTVALAWVVAALSAASLLWGGMSASIASVFEMPASSAQDEVVSREQAEFLAQIDVIVPEGQRVLGDPWDGSAWTWVYGHREPVFPHVNGQWDEDRRALAWRLEQIESNPQVCDALDRLEVRYVVYSPHDLGSGDPAGNHFPGPHRAVEQGLFDVVAQAGDTQLLRIDQCGPLP